MSTMEAEQQKLNFPKCVCVRRFVQYVCELSTQV